MGLFVATAMAAKVAGQAGPTGATGERGAPGSASTPPTAVSEAPPYDKVFALCVGINKYANPVVLPDLRFAETDASSLANVFTEKYGYTTSTVLGDKATHGGINKAIDALIAHAGPNDVLIFYFAGHGMTVLTTPTAKPEGASASAAGETAQVYEGYLLPQDLAVNVKNVDDETVYRSGAINMRELTARLTGPTVKAKHVLLLLDCCASGMAVATRSVALSRDFTREVASLPTRQIITAGKDSQKAYEIATDEAAGKGHGVFTYVLLKLLETRNAQSVFGILPDLQQEVFNTVQEKFNARVVPQHKVLVDNGGDYVFIPTGVNWAEAVKTGGSASGDGRGAVKPTTDAEVVEVTTAAKTTPHNQSLENDPTWRRRVDDYELRAAAGDTRAMEALVVCYTHGLGVKKDPDRAFYWSTQAHEARDDRGSAMMAEFLKAGQTGAVRNSAAAPAAGAAVSSSLPPEVQNAVAGYNLLQSLNGGSGNVGAAANASTVNDAANLIGNVWSMLGSSDKASFSDRLTRVRGELDKSRTDWNEVLKHLRAWAEDIKKTEATIPEASRASLQSLRERVDELWRKARQQKKAELKTELDAAASLVGQLGGAGGGQ
jgi:TPR repeat protein